MNVMFSLWGLLPFLDLVITPRFTPTPTPILDQVVTPVPTQATESFSLLPLLILLILLLVFVGFLIRDALRKKK